MNVWRGSIRAALGDASMSSKFASPAAVPVLSSRLVPLLALALGVLGCMSAAPSGGSARRDGATATGTDGGGGQSPAAGTGGGGGSMPVATGGSGGAAATGGPRRPTARGAHASGGRAPRGPPGPRNGPPHARGPPRRGHRGPPTRKDG